MQGIFDNPNILQCTYIVHMTKSVDDVHSFETGLKQAKERLQKAVWTYEEQEYEGREIRPLTPENKLLIEKFLLKLRREELAPGTVLVHVNYITRFAQVLLDLDFKDSILDVDADTFDLFLMQEEDSGTKPGTLRNYKKTLKKFFGSMCEDSPKWVKQLKLKAVESPVQPCDLLTREELDLVLDTCTNARDKAFIAVLADGGIRVGALASCRIKNVSFGQYGATIYLSKTSKSNKTTTAKGIPLTWSTGYLNQWLSLHPFKNNLEAPLWTTSNKNGEAMSYKSWRMTLKNIGMKAGIQKRLNPHTFRHMAVTNWIFDGLSEQEIKHRAGWSKGSDRMFKTYANFTDDEINNSIYEKYGLKEDRRQITLKKCPRCNNVLRDEDRFCPQCSLVLSNEAFQEVQEQKNDLIQMIRYAMEDPEFQIMLETLSKRKGV